MRNFAFLVAAAAVVAGTAAPARADPPAVVGPAVAAPAVVVPISAEAMATDPRMVAAVRHANLMADHKCGEGVGGIVDLATKADAQRCRRRMVANAKLDAESEIAGR